MSAHDANDGEEDDGAEDATRMMSSRSLVDEAEAQALDALEHADGDATVPMSSAHLFAKLRPAVTVPMGRDGGSLQGQGARGAAQQGQSPQQPRSAQQPQSAQPPQRAQSAASGGEVTVPQQRRIAVDPRASSQFGPPSAYRPTPLPVPPPPPYAQNQSLPQAHYEAARGSVPPPPYAQNQSPPQPAFPASVRGGAPSARVPSVKAPKLRSPSIFIAVMVTCTVLTITGLVLLAYLKVRHFW